MGGHETGPCGNAPSRPEQRGRYDGDAVTSAVGRASRRHDHRVEQIVADRRGQPPQIPHVRVVDTLRQLDLDGDDAPIAAFDDEIDLAQVASRTQMTHGGFGRLRKDAD